MAREFMKGPGKESCVFCAGPSEGTPQGLAPYHREMAQYQLTFMPFGNAYERFALFEALWLGLVVVTLDWPGAAKAYDGLPVVRISSMEEINPSNIAAWTDMHEVELLDLPTLRRNKLSGQAWGRRILAMAAGQGTAWPELA